MRSLMLSRILRLAFVGATLSLVASCGITESSRSTSNDTQVPIPSTVRTELRSTSSIAGNGLPQDLAVRINNLEPGVVRGWSTGADGTTITLRADQRRLAEELFAQYGSTVHVQLGNFAYPLDLNTAPDVCPALGSEHGTNESLAATITLASKDVLSGDDFSATVSVMNISSKPLSILGGSITPIIRRPGYGPVVAVPDLATAGSDVAVLLQPGETHTLDVRVGTASCDPKLGAALPPGTYDLVVDIGAPESSLDRRSELVAGPVSVHVQPL